MYIIHECGLGEIPFFIYIIKKRIKILQVAKNDENGYTVTRNEVFDIVFTDKQSIAAGTAFRDYINERLEDEK